MSDVQELEDRVEGIENELKEARGRLESWEAKRDAALSELEGAFDDDDATYKRSMILQEARSACNHFQAKIAELERAKKQAKRALVEARYDVGLQEIRQKRREASREIAICEEVLIQQIKDLYDCAWDWQDEANQAIDQFNSRLANALGRAGQATISKMNGLSADMWVEAVMRDAIQSGEL